jgi:hypothetical protein
MVSSKSQVKRSQKGKSVTYRERYWKGTRLEPRESGRREGVTDTFPEGDIFPFCELLTSKLSVIIYYYSINKKGTTQLFARFLWVSST